MLIKQYLFLLISLNDVVKINVIKKTEYNELVKKVNNINHDHAKYITTLKFNKLMSEHFATRLRQANLSSKKDIANFIKKDRF